MSAPSGSAFAPEPVPAPVVARNEFVVGAVRFDHGHIYGMCEGLTGAGATLRWAYDPDPVKVEAFRMRFHTCWLLGASQRCSTTPRYVSSPGRP